MQSLKLSGMTKMKAQKGWVAVKDIDCYPSPDGNGMAIWIWPDTGQRQHPICLDCVGPHGLEDLARLVQFIQERLDTVTPGPVYEESEVSDG